MRFVCYLDIVLLRSLLLVLLQRCRRHRHRVFLVLILRTKSILMMDIPCCKRILRIRMIFYLRCKREKRLIYIYMCVCVCVSVCMDMSCLFSSDNAAAVTSSDERKTCALRWGWYITMQCTREENRTKMYTLPFSDQSSNVANILISPRIGVSTTSLILLQTSYVYVYCFIHICRE
jgi:hypothetical protein